MREIGIQEPQQGDSINCQEQAIGPTICIYAIGGNAGKRCRDYRVDTVCWQPDDPDLPFSLRHDPQVDGLSAPRSGLANICKRCCGLNPPWIGRRFYRIPSGISNAERRSRFFRSRRIVVSPSFPTGRYPQLALTMARGLMWRRSDRCSNGCPRHCTD